MHPSGGIAPFQYRHVYLFETAIPRLEFAWQKRIMYAAHFKVAAPLGFLTVRGRVTVTWRRMGCAVDDGYSAKKKNMLGTRLSCRIDSCRGVFLGFLLVKYSSGRRCSRRKDCLTYRAELQEHPERYNYSQSEVDGEFCIC